MKDPMWTQCRCGALSRQGRSGWSVSIRHGRRYVRVEYVLYSIEDAAKCNPIAAPARRTISTVHNEVGSSEQRQTEKALLGCRPLGLPFGPSVRTRSGFDASGKLANWQCGRRTC